jgi:hypothetical protein
MSPARTSKRCESDDCPLRVAGSSRMGKTATSAGSSASVRSSAISTPIGPKTPRCEIGRSSAITKEKSPPAVVRLVISTASPECPKAKAIDSSLLCARRRAW